MQIPKPDLSDALILGGAAVTGYGLSRISVWLLVVFLGVLISLAGFRVAH